MQSMSGAHPDLLHQFCDAEWHAEWTCDSGTFIGPAKMLGEQCHL